MTRRLAAVLAASCVLAIAYATPAAAEARGRIVGITSGEGSLRIVFSVAGLEPGQAVDPSSVRLTLGGTPVEAQVASGSDGGAQVARVVMLAVDTSGSMAGEGIEGARAAATAFLDRVPADVQVGLVTFADTATLAVPLSTDREAVRAAVAGLEARGDTALYDAVALAFSNLPSEGDRQVLLLSDGADDGSTTSLEEVTALLTDGEIALNSVAFQNTQVQSTLGQLTEAAGGRVVSAQQTAELSAAFEQAATSLDDQLVVNVAVPPELDGQEATVTVQAVAAGQTLTDSALVAGLRAAPEALPAQDFGPRPIDTSTGLLQSQTTVYAALAALFLGLAYLLTTALVSAVGNGSGRRSLAGRLSIYTLRGGDAAAARAKAAQQADGQSAVARSAVGLADRVVQSRGLEAGLARRLDAGGIPLKPAEWLLVHVGSVVVLPLFVLLISNANLPLVGAAFLLALAGPLLYLKVKQSRRTSAFLAQLPDVLQLLSGSLGAGYSLPQALDAVVRQGNEPMASELNKALVEARLGAPIEDALDDAATRMDSIDFRWVVMAIRIQRDVGGNLAEILATVSATMRERERLRRQVQVLSAEGRLSAVILGGLPPVFGLYLLAAQPDYLNPLFTEPLGLLMLGFTAVVMTIGVVWLRKVVQVEV